MRYESDLSMENAIYDLPRCRKEEYKKDNSSINFSQWSRETEYIVRTRAGILNFQNLSI